MLWKKRFFNSRVEMVYFRHHCSCYRYISIICYTDPCKLSALILRQRQLIHGSLRMKLLLVCYNHMNHVGCCLKLYLSWIKECFQWKLWIYLKSHSSPLFRGTYLFSILLNVQQKYSSKPLASQEEALQGLLGVISESLAFLWNLIFPSLFKVLFWILLIRSYMPSCLGCI